MTPEYKAWLKAPRRSTVDAVAKKHGCTVKAYVPLFGEHSETLVTLYRADSNIPIEVGKGKRARDVFDFREAIKILKTFPEVQQ